MDKKVTRSKNKKIFKKKRFSREKSARGLTSSPIEKKSSNKDEKKGDSKLKIKRREFTESIRTGWIGTDESGKGDYFGPLVVAGVYVDHDAIPVLRQLKVRDSKKISEGVIKELDYKIRSMCRYSVVVVGPEKYNLLHSRMKNMNRILAWGHARVIENLLQLVDSPRVLSDQFGDENYIKNALMKLGKKIKLEQRHGAETDLAVASASIIARAEFLKRMEGLSRDCELNLPKGASPQTEDAAREVLKKLGRENLEKYVKLHFKNTKKVLQTSKELT